jgi:antitoxin FitA
MGALQVKNVPPELHEQLRRRAAAAGLTLADYVLDVLRREVALPTWEEWFADLGQLDPGPSTRRAPAEAVRAARRARDRRLRDATRS